MPAPNTQMLQALAGVHQGMERAFARFWATQNLAAPTAVRNATLRLAPTLVDTYGHMAGTLAADWYDDLRRAEGIPGAYRSTVANPVSPERVQERVRFGASTLWTDNPDLFRKFVSAALVGYITEQFGETIATNAAQDPQAAGWQRILEPGACDFCRMLAGRGGVYKKSTARFAAHHNCRCGARPSWDSSAPEVPVSAYQASERTSKMTEAQRAEHNRRIRAWIDAHQ